MGRSNFFKVAAILGMSTSLILAYQNCSLNRLSTIPSSYENSESESSAEKKEAEPTFGNKESDPTSENNLVDSTAPISPEKSPVETSPNSCLKWKGANKTTSKEMTEDLQLAVNLNKCVEIQSGTFEIERSIKIPSGHTVQGIGAMSVIKAKAATWNFHCCDTLFDAGNAGQDITIKNLTLDGSGIATYAIGFRGIEANNVIMTNARCSGVGIAGPQMKIINSTIKNSALTVNIAGRGLINCASGGGGVAEGAAIYALSPAQQSQNFAPIIAGNSIFDNFGPALDCDGVFGGTFSSNKVYRNKTFAAVSLYGASNWTIVGNSIQHPNDGGGQPYHPDCARGTAGAKSSGIFLCQDTEEYNRFTRGNRIENNQVSSFYGILSVGSTTNPNLIPQKNIFKGNNVLGSNVGCADDLRPGEVPRNENLWEGNNCRGVNNSSPDYF